MPGVPAGGRFFPLLGDVAQLSRSGEHIPLLLERAFPGRGFSAEAFPGFDLAIIGITASNNRDTEHYSGTKVRPPAQAHGPRVLRPGFLKWG